MKTDSFEGLRILGSTTEQVIVSRNVSGESSVKIFDLRGNVIFNKKVNFEKGKVILNVSLRVSDIYILEVDQVTMKFTFSR